MVQVTRLLRALCFGWLLLSHCYATALYAQSKSEEPVAASIECAIEAESETWSRGGPILVAVKIRNISDKAVDLVGWYSFELTKDSDSPPTGYWSPVNILNGTPLKLETESEWLEKGIVVGKVPQGAIHLEPHETKEMKFDVTKLSWDKSISSIWPNHGLFVAVPKGDYDLIFDIQTDSRKNSQNVPIFTHIASNKVGVSVR